MGRSILNLSFTSRNTSRKMYQLYNSVKNDKNNNCTYRITIPKSVAEKYENCYFTIYDIGDKIILASGTNIANTTKEELEYNKMLWNKVSELE